MTKYTKTANEAEMIETLAEIHAEVHEFFEFNNSKEGGNKTGEILNSLNTSIIAALTFMQCIRQTIEEQDVRDALEIDGFLERAKNMTQLSTEAYMSICGVTSINLTNSNIHPFDPSQKAN